MNRDNLFGERKGLEVNMLVNSPQNIPNAAGKLVVANLPFGDPMAAIRIDRQKRWLFFDLGSFAQVSARTAHQISDIFISHAHVDHLCGLPWLLGRRINIDSSCRVFGLPGLCDHWEAMVRAFVWDRVCDQGPRFKIAELHGDTLQWWSLQVGGGERVRLPDTPAHSGLLLEDPLFRVSAITLDHGIPVLAYAFEELPSYTLQSEKIEAMGLQRGSWIAELQSLYKARDLDASLSLPDGSMRSVRWLAEQFLVSRRGQKIVYATDFAATVDNYTRLVEFAYRADLMVCERSYTSQDVEHALRTGHNTAQHCAKLALDAQIGHLVPFHFSNRYVENPEVIYREISDIFPSVEIPTAVQTQI
jgi:ribonuclease BN (tRNA processing enzyme)